MSSIELNSDENIVELIDLSLSNSAGVGVFYKLNFTLSSGKTAVIIGQSGVGKTSLIRLLVGNKKPDSGAVVVFGCKMDIRNERLLEETRKKIGGVGGIFEPISYETVYENLMYPLILRGDGSRYRKLKVMQVLSQLRLLSKKREKARSLSRGEKVLLMLGRATIADQPLLLIDEPMAGLDVKMSSEILTLLKRLTVAGHTMIVFTTGQTGLRLPNASEYFVENGQLR